MPRKKQESPRSESLSAIKKRSTFGGFVTCNLNKDELQSFQVWLQNGGANYLDLVDGLLSAGYTLSVLLDEDNASYTARFYYLDVKAEIGYMLTAFAPTWPDAVALLLFKHLVILDGDWSNGLRKDLQRPSFG